MEDPVSIYIRLTDYNSKVLTSNGTYRDKIDAVEHNVDIHNQQFIQVLSYSSDVEQVLNIMSQSSGAGAGKIQFNPLKITRLADDVSPVLFACAGSGKAFRTVEVFFTGADNVVQIRQTYKLVAVKTVAWSAVSGEPGMFETVTFEYGGLILSVYGQSKTSDVSQAGWNRVKNISDNDLNTVIS